MVDSFAPRGGALRRHAGAPRRRRGPTSPPRSPAPWRPPHRRGSWRSGSGRGGSPSRCRDTGCAVSASIAPRRCWPPRAAQGARRGGPTPPGPGRRDGPPLRHGQRRCRADRPRLPPDPRLAPRPARGAARPPPRRLPRLRQRARQPCERNAPDHRTMAGAVVGAGQHPAQPPLDRRGGSGRVARARRLAPRTETVARWTGETTVARTLARHASRGLQLLLGGSPRRSSPRPTRRSPPGPPQHIPSPSRP